MIHKLNFSLALAAAVLVVTVLLPSSVKAQSEDEKALMSFNLTSARMEKYVAVMEKAAAMEAANPELARKAEREDSDKDQSLAGMVRSIERSPELTSLIKSHGFSVREYVLMTFALLEASMYSYAKKANPSMKPPANTNMANVAFVESHQAEMQKWEARMNAAQGTQKSARKTR